MAEYKKITGVNSVPYSSKKEDILFCQEVEKAMVGEGVVFKDCPTNQVPWLIATQPFKPDNDLRLKIEELGKAIFLFFDAVQCLYKNSELVRELLDINVCKDLIGLGLDKKIITFRLDIIISNGSPKITEVEEIYGNAGKMHAMQNAYGVNYDSLFAAFANTGIDCIFFDDTVTSYIPELSIMTKRLKTQFGINVLLKPFSEFKSNYSGTAWRFCYTKDLNQYPLNHRKKITSSKANFFNPLFHGFGSKAIFILLFKEQFKDELIKLMGSKYYYLLRDGSIKSELLDPKNVNLESLINNRKNIVLKVLDSPKNLDYNWGSRGVFFGDTSKQRWEKIMQYALNGQIPFEPKINEVRYIVSELVESDRYDVPFWDRNNNQISLMTNARIRLGPIFFRDKNQNVELVAGHATFVNTSRKVHLGKHSVCGPILI